MDTAEQQLYTGRREKERERGGVYPGWCTQGGTQDPYVASLLASRPYMSNMALIWSNMALIYPNMDLYGPIWTLEALYGLWRPWRPWRPWYPGGTLVAWYRVLVVPWRPVPGRVLEVP